jgi:hypothetical protein
MARTKESCDKVEPRESRPGGLHPEPCGAQELIGDLQDSEIARCFVVLPSCLYEHSAFSCASCRHVRGCPPALHRPRGVRAVARELVPTAKAPSVLLKVAFWSM